MPSILSGVVKKFNNFFGSSKTTNIATNDKNKGESQAYLLKNISKLNKKQSFDYVLNVDAEPHLVLSKLNNSLEMVDFIESIRPHELAALTPYIKLFKVSEKNGKRIEKELLFDTHLNSEQINSIFQGKTGRGGGVGIKSFNWEYVGTNPAESKRFIEADLKIFFSSIQELAKRQKNDVAFLDLILPEIAQIGVPSEINPKHYRLKVEIGWNPPPASHQLFKRNPKLLKAIQLSNVSLHLNLKRHSIKFENDGSATLDCQYYAELEGLFSQEQTDIFKFFNTGFKEPQIQYQKQRLKSLKKELQSCKAVSSQSKKNAKKSRKLKKRVDYINGNIKDAKIVLRDYLGEQKSLIYKAILTEILNTDKLYVIEDKIEEIYPSTIQTTPDSPNKPKINKTKSKANNAKLQKPNKVKRKTGVGRYVDKSSKLTRLFDLKGGKRDSELQTYLTKNVKPETKDGSAKVYFMYLGDILSVVLKGVYSRKDIESYNFRLMTGKVDILGEEVLLTNIPISMDYFQAWFLKKVIKLGKTRWYVKDFLNELFQELVVPVLGSKALDDSKLDKKSKMFRHKFRFAFLSVPSEKTGKCVVTNLGKNKQYKKELPSISKSHISKLEIGTSKENMTNYLYVFTSGENSSIRVKNYLKDIEEGIYHFYLGKDAGTLQTIEFEQDNMKYLEVAQAQGRDISKYKRLYNVNLNLYYSKAFVPGTLIYIDTRSIGFSSHDQKDLAAEMGLGGYYQVLKNDNTFESGILNTKLKCRYLGSGLQSKKLGNAQRSELKCP